MCGARWPRCGAPDRTMYSPIFERCWAPGWMPRQAYRGNVRQSRRSTLFPTSPTDMNQRHAAVLVLAVAACGGSGPKVALRFHPPAGAVYHYALEQRTEISILSGPLAAMGKQHFFMRMPFTETVKGPAREGGTEVEVVFESLTMEIPGGTSQAGAARTTLTVREIRIAGSDTTVVLDIKTTFPSGPIPLAVGSQTGTVKLDGDLAGHQQFSISRGAILDGTIKGATKVHVAGGMLASKGMDLLTDTESSIFLLPD